MLSKIAGAALAAGLVAASPAPAGVTAAISPKENIPSDCQTSYSNPFQIEIMNVTESKSKRDTTGSVPLVSTLKDGVLTDAKGRTGYIASNNQFQYDGPPQAGAIYTAGFSVCSNGSLALGNSAIFYKCLSGTFYNLYDESGEEQCSPVYIQVLPQGGASTTAAAAGASGAASQLGDGQVTASPVSNVACQIGDGQLQDNTCTGQVATTAAAVTQIGDGQIQAPSAVAHPVSQITDGQIQAPTAVATGAYVAPAANNGTVSKPTVAPYTGAASSVTFGVSGLVAGLVAVLAL